MTGTRPLDAVARVRRVHEDAAARELAAAQERARAESARASELLGYLHEYEAAPVRASAQWLANRTVFLGRLQEAVRAQATRLQQAEAAVEACRTRYMLARQDRDVLDRLQAGYQRAADHEARRRAQDALDDWAGSRCRASA